MLTDDALKALWDSTAALHERFGTTRHVDAQMRVFFEEVYEFTSQVVVNKDMLSAETRVEAADVIVTILSTLQSMGATWDDVASALNWVRRKNDAKTHETHYVHPKTGKITRREQS